MRELWNEKEDVKAVDTGPQEWACLTAQAHGLYLRLRFCLQGRPDSEQLIQRAYRRYRRRVSQGNYTNH